MGYGPNTSALLAKHFFLWITTIQYVKPDCGTIKALMVDKRANLKHHALDISNSLHFCSNLFIPRNAESFSIRNDAACVR